MPVRSVRFSLIAMSGVMSLIIPACSNYEGRHLAQSEPLADPSAWDGDGIPYNLPAPEFTLQRLVVEGKASYAVNVSYVPAADQRYTLRVDPSWLQSVGFDFDLSDQGQVTSVGSKQTDQIVPTIAAIGGLIASIVAVPFMGPPAPPPPEDQAGDEPPTQDEQEELRALLPQVCRFENQALYGSVACRFSRPLVNDNIKGCLFNKDPRESVAAPLLVFAQRYILDPFGRPLVDANDAGLRSDLHPRNPAEVTCLRAFYSEQRLNSPSNGGVDAANAFLLDKFKELPLRNKALQALMAGILKDRLESENPGPLRELSRAARQVLLRRPESAEPFKRLLKEGREEGPAAASDMNDGVLEELAEAVLVAIEARRSEYLETALDKEKWTALLEGARERRAEIALADMLATAVTLDVASWRARHLRYLDRRIEELERSAMVVGPEAGPPEPAGSGENPRSCPPEPSLITRDDPPEKHDEERNDIADLAKCREERAWTIGEYATLRRLYKLDHLLDQVPPDNPPGGETSAFEEYARVRAEHELLQNRLKVAAAKVAEGAAPPGVAPFDPKPVPVVAPGCVTQGVGTKACDNDSEWPPEADDAEFVITLEKIGAPS